MSGALEADSATPLFHGERGNPDGNETILTEPQTEVRVSRHLKKELAVASAVDQLASARTTERNAAKNERPGMEPKPLFRLVALLLYQRDGIQVLQTLLRNRKGIKNRLNGCKARASWGLTRRRESAADDVLKGQRRVREKGETGPKRAAKSLGTAGKFGLELHPDKTRQIDSSSPGPTAAGSAVHPVRMTRAPVPPP